ncbi:MAG: CsbD family protein [Myxococcota bacterium]
MGEFLDKAKGKFKKVFGVATGKRRVEAAGKVDTAKGKAKGAAEEVKHDIKQASRETRSPPPPAP